MNFYTSGSDRFAINLKDGDAENHFIRVGNFNPKSKLMKKNIILSTMACAMVFISCQKDEVVNEEPVNQEKNVVYRYPLGGEAFINLDDYDPDEPMASWCAYPGTDCFPRVMLDEFSAVHQLADEPTIWDDETAMQGYVADHRDELEPYFHSELLEGVLSGELRVEKTGSFAEDEGGIVYIKFMDNTASDMKVVRVQPFSLR